MKRISAVIMFVILLWGSTMNVRSNGLVLKQQEDETEESIYIDFPKVRGRFLQGNLKTPLSFQKEIFLYEVVSNAVNEYTSDMDVEDVFRLDLEGDMFSENTKFLLSDTGETGFYEYPLEQKKIDLGQEHFKLKVEGWEHTLYVDVDLEKEKLFLYPPECSSLRIVDNWDGNPEVYKMIQRKKGEGVIYYPDMYVISDWNDMGQTDNHFTETYDGMYEKIRELDYLVIPEDLQGYDAVYIDIAVVLNRYMEEKHIEDVFYFDCEKDVVCQVTNMIFTCRLRGREQTLYVDLDTFNLKAHVYEVEK